MTKRLDPALFLDDHRGHYIARDFAQCIKRDRLVGVSAEDLDALAAYEDEGGCPCHDQHDAQFSGDSDAHGPMPDCEYCRGTGTVDSEICDEIFQDICDNALVILQADYLALPRDPLAREVFLDSLREGRTRDANRILADVGDDVQRLSGMATVRAPANRPGSALAWPTGIVECVLDVADLPDNPLGIVLGRVEMHEGAVWLIPVGMVWDDHADWYRWPDDDDDELARDVPLEP